MSLFSRVHPFKVKNKNYPIPHTRDCCLNYMEYTEFSFFQIKQRMFQKRKKRHLPFFIQRVNFLIQEFPTSYNIANQWTS